MELIKAKVGELLPCPFCGESEELYFEKYQHRAGERFRVVCSRCMAQIDRGYDQNIHGLIKAWNNRK